MRQAIATGLAMIALPMMALAVTPAFAQTTAVAPPVACTCATPAPAAAPTRVRTTRPARWRARDVPASTPVLAPFDFRTTGRSDFRASTTATVFAMGPATEMPVTSGGLLGPITPDNQDSIAFLGLSYTDGFLGAEAGAGGSGPLHAGY